MNASSTPLESEIATWLVDLIQNEELVEAISGTEALFAIAESLRQTHFIPSFSIDYKSRRACAEAAEHVLSQLAFLEIISVNMSISLTRGEVLRPDILCFNPESRTLVVFEIKRAAETERQTITELGGYEQELRNLLPFIGDYDICFVVVATEWSTLLNHAVGGLNTWSGKKCLALKLAFDAPEKGFNLSCHLPEAWHLTGSVTLAPDALQTINLYLGEDEPDPDENRPPRSVITAMDVIARAGDRAGSHGFMMLWKDVNGQGGGRWGLTLCGIDPYAMYAWWREHGLPQRDSDAARFFDKHRTDSPPLVPASIFTHVDKARPLLANRYDLELGDAFSWDTQLTNLKLQAIPIRFEFWGSLGEYAREFICNPSVRDQYMPYIGHFDLDWTEPDVALPLIQNLASGTPFAGGQIRCSDAFKAGLAIGTLIIALRNAARSEKAAAQLEPLVCWAQYEALRHAIEMQQISSAAENILEPIPSLTNKPELRLQAAEALRLWVHVHLLGDDHALHQKCFQVGCGGPFLFGNLAQQCGYELPKAPREQILADLRALICNTVESIPGSVGQQIQSAGYVAFKKNLDQHLDVGSCRDKEEITRAIYGIPEDELVGNFPSLILNGMDSIIPVVVHQAAPVPVGDIDWGYLKAGIKALYDAGNRHAAVLRDLNGLIGTGTLDKGLTKFCSPLTDPAVEAYFYDALAGSSMLVKMTWERLMETVGKIR